ncbi:MAG: hypothetical protein EA001_11090 [Oscillatoriales cyanobacterium]|nr:MAG: hypothetical protein EA001_11090 [Oscillatoriales cyanobacterium]
MRGLIRLLDWAATELETESALPPAARISRPALTPARAGHTLLGWVRPWLPESLRRLSDRNLTIALSVMGSVVLVAAIAIFPPQFKPPTTVASQPPALEPLKPLLPKLLELPEPEATESPEATEPPEAIAPEPSEPAPIAQQPPSPPPKLELSPEQQAIATIQEDASQIATRYGDPELIASIRADFRSSRLIVVVPDEAWFNLGDRQQDRFTADLLTRSRRLDFSKLELQNPQGILWARSPVVGDRIVIFQRSALETQPASPNLPS